MELKTCKTCNIEKELTLDNYKKTDAGRYWANECRDCQNIKRRARRKGIDMEKSTEFIEYKPKINNQDRIVNTNSNISTNNNIDKFSTEEITKIKELITLLPEVKKLKNKIEFTKSDGYKRTVRSINLDDRLYNLLKEKSKEKDLSISDIVNILLNKAIELI